VKLSKRNLDRLNPGCLFAIVLTAVVISLLICWFDQA